MQQNDVASADIANYYNFGHMSIFGHVAVCVEVILYILCAFDHNSLKLRICLSLWPQLTTPPFFTAHFYIQ